MNIFDHLWIEKYLFYVVVVVVVIELVLYVHGQQLRSCRDGQLSYPHCSWASLPEAGRQYLAPILTSFNEKKLFLNQRKRKNGRRNIFMTKSSRKDMSDARIDRGAP